jgi:hypothetical protein
MSGGQRNRAGRPRGGVLKTNESFHLDEDLPVIVYQAGDTRNREMARRPITPELVANLVTRLPKKNAEGRYSFSIDSRLLQR